MSATAQIAKVLDSAGVARLLSSVGAWRGTLVLNYHRIAPADTRPTGEGWSATEDELDSQLRYLNKHVEVVGPEALLERRNGRSVILTFDDGYRDNYERALPLLREHGVPATFFLATGFLDRGGVAWWEEIDWMVQSSTRPRLNGALTAGAELSLGDKAARRKAVARLLERYKQLPGGETEQFLDQLAQATGSGRLDPGEGRDAWMTWDMARELLAAGMSIGGHSVSHPVLARLPQGQQRREILECRDRLAQELGIPMELFSYPVGLPGTFDERTIACLREAGVRLAFSYYGGYSRLHVPNPYDVPRSSVWLGMQPERFHALTALPQVFARW